MKMESLKFGANPEVPSRSLEDEDESLTRGKKKKKRYIYINKGERH